MKTKELLSGMSCHGDSQFRAWQPAVTHWRTRQIKIPALICIWENSAIYLRNNPIICTRSLHRDEEKQSRTFVLPHSQLYNSSTAAGPFVAVWRTRTRLPHVLFKRPVWLCVRALVIESHPSWATTPMQTAILFTAPFLLFIIICLHG